MLIAKIEAEQFERQGEITGNSVHELVHFAPEEGQ